MWEPDFSLLGQTDTVAVAQRIPTPEVGTWFLDLSTQGPPVPPRPPTPPRAPDPPRKKPRVEAPPPPARLPYDERPCVGHKPWDPRRGPFQNAGLMRDIGGVDGFMKVMRGTHRFPETY